MKVFKLRVINSNHRITSQQVYNAYQSLLSGLGKMLQVCHSASAVVGTDEYVRDNFSFPSNEIP